jgi:hypothetical protein
LTHPVIAQPFDLTLSSASGKEDLKKKNELHLFFAAGEEVDYRSAVG